MAVQGPIGKENLVNFASEHSFCIHCFGYKFQIEFQEISFRLKNKTQLFDGSNNALLNAKYDIVASASCHGLVFLGSSDAELIVICLKDLEEAQDPNQNIPSRKVPLASPTSQIATNCDGSILAVVLKLNGVLQIELFSVQSFLTPVS